MCFGSEGTACRARLDAVVDGGRSSVRSEEHDEPAQLGSLAVALPIAVPRSIGAYLHGSAGSGRLRGQSDLDVVLVTAAPLTAAERTNLTSLLLDVSGRYPRPPGGPRPVELTVVVSEEIRPWCYPPRCELLYGEWLRAEVEEGRCLDAFECPDLALLLTMVLVCRSALFGPDPSRVIDPIPSRDVIRATTAGVTGLVDDLEGDTTNVLLTLARVWHTCATGALASKDSAAAWARRRTPRPVGHVLERAEKAYLGGWPHRWGPVTDDARRAAGFLVDAIQGCTRRD